MVDDGSMWISELTFEHGSILAHEDKTDGLRLITMITAKKGDGTVYWKTPFYRSTGFNSSFPGLWFPFAGFSNKTRPGKNTITNYFSKSLGLPSGWPIEDVLVGKGLVHERVRNIIDRIMTRSFLLASNSMEAFGENPGNKALNIRTLMNSIEQKAVDGFIRTTLNDNTNFKAYEAMYETLPHSSSQEINKMIGTDLYFNPYLEDKLNLSASNVLPNYESNVLGRIAKTRGGAQRRTRAKKRATRKNKVRK